MDAGSCAAALTSAFQSSSCCVACRNVVARDARRLPRCAGAAALGRRRKRRLTFCRRNAAPSPGGYSLRSYAFYILSNHNHGLQRMAAAARGVLYADAAQGAPRWFENKRRRGGGGGRHGDAPRFGVKMFFLRAPWHFALRRGLAARAWHATSSWFALQTRYGDVTWFRIVRPLLDYQRRSAFLPFLPPYSSYARAA